MNYPGQYYYIFPVNENDRQERQQKNEGIGGMESKIMTPEDSLRYGNLYADEYIGYKKYIPKLPIAHDERESKLQQIMMFSGVAHDLVLHLDVYPKDIKSIELFKAYSKKATDLQNEYQNKYGPLTASNASDIGGTFSWITYPSPWLNA